MAVIKAFSGEDILIDDEDYELIAKFKWSVTKPGHRRTVYARTNILTEGEKYVPERMHRIILGVKPGSNILIDHINGNGLDNRKGNLRIASRSENASNSAPQKRNRSGYKGVSFKGDRTKPWCAEVRKNYKNVYRKSFKCKHCAARYYNEKALEVHGEFAWTNDVQGCDCDAGY